jgi:hypothetical protein
VSSSHKHHVEADGDVVLQPGVGYVDLNLELKERGIPLFLPVRPPAHTVTHFLMSSTARSRSRCHGWRLVLKVLACSHFSSTLMLEGMFNTGCSGSEFCCTSNLRWS